MKCVFSLFFIFTFITMGQNTYYVDERNPSASDSSSGTELEPWKTIQHAADVVPVGSTVIVKAGSYDRTTFNNSGTQNNYIRFQGENEVNLSDSSVNAITQGFYVNADYIEICKFEITDIGSNNRGGININFSNNIVIEGNYFHELECTYGNWGAVRGDGAYIEIRNNVMYKVEGITVNIRGNNWLVKENDISHGTDLTPSGNDVSGDADAIRFFGRNHIIRNNYLHDFLPNEGSQTNPPHMDAFQTYSVNPGEIAQDILIEKNLIDNFGAQGLMCEDDDIEDNVNNITMSNNIFANLQGYTAINVRACENFKFFHNLVINSGIGIRLRDGSDSSQVINNIFYNNRGNAIFNEDSVSEIGSVWDYNLHTPTFSFPTGYQYDQNSLIGVDPLFVNETAMDFHLQENSPAIDNGTSSSRVYSDFDGKIRPLLQGWDIGPFEYGEILQFLPSTPSGVKIE